MKMSWKLRMDRFSLLQPIDQGVIEACKRCFRKIMLWLLLEADTLQRSWFKSWPSLKNWKISWITLDLKRMLYYMRFFSWLSEFVRIWKCYSCWCWRKAKFWFEWTWLPDSGWYWNCINFHVWIQFLLRLDPELIFNVDYHLSGHFE